MSSYENGAAQSNLTGTNCKMEQDHEHKTGTQRTYMQGQSTTEI